MKKLPGYFFLTIGLMAVLFFMSYSGTHIPNRELWIVFSFFFIIFGGFLIAQQKLESLRQNLIRDNQSPKNNTLVKTGEKIRVTLDNCEVKTHSYLQEVFNNSFSDQTQLLDSLPDTGKNDKTENIAQTYILFIKQYGNKTYKFISQAITQSPEVVKKYLDDNKGIDLYVDKKDPTNYFFDI